MIRFCDREVYCITEAEMSIPQLREYFFDGHRDDMICIMDEAGKFTGTVTYYSFLGRDLSEAVKKEYLVLDEHIWGNGRKLFRYRQKNFNKTDLIPVLDKSGRLLCFAWQDEEADREIRMLEELEMHKCALGFHDVYPEYDCVEINGCNELACYLVQYLKKQGILVHVTGAFWKELGIWNDDEALDYKTLTVYGEGTGVKEEIIDRKESVSAEFECVNHIYEANIRDGVIRDAEGDTDQLLEKLNGRPIGILGVGKNAADAYDLLLGYGIDIHCFVADNSGLQTLLGKKVLKLSEAMSEDHIVFIGVNDKYSAWGFGGADQYAYMGYQRNRDFFLLQDYMEIPRHGLIHVIRHMAEQSKEKVVLLGEPELCLSLKRILQTKENMESGQIVYCDILHSFEHIEGLNCILPEEISEKNECLLLLSQYHGCYVDDARKIMYRDALIERYRVAFQNFQIVRVAEYSVDNNAFMEMNSSDDSLEEKNKLHFKVKKLIIGGIQPHSGNMFFQGILFGHPELCIIQDGFLSYNLYSVCIRLAAVSSDRILSLFWELYDEMTSGNRSRFSDEQKFNQSMEEMLAAKRYFTSQEIFVMLHAACQIMQDGKKKAICEMILYWEPHINSAYEKENFAVWLKGVAAENYIVNVVRNAYIRAGSMIRLAEENNQQAISWLSDILCFPKEKEKEYDGFRRIILKFEDLKCEPEKWLRIFCGEIGIVWSDMLLEIPGIFSYNGVKGFDLGPVYRTWEKYFSSFDRFRISLTTNAWQKKYGYPYVNSLDFSRKELRDMFSKEFRFEKRWIFQSEEAESRFLKWRRRIISSRLWEVRREDYMRSQDVLQEDVADV